MYILLYACCQHEGQALDRRSQMIIQKAVTTPTKKPTTTWASECWRKIIRLVPTMPAMIMLAQNHPKGLNEKRMENANSPPTNPPMPAVCVDIFHLSLIHI